MFDQRVVLYSQQDDDRDKIVGELRQIINNTEYLKGSTEPPKLVASSGADGWLVRDLADANMNSE